MIVTYYINKLEHNTAVYCDLLCYVLLFLFLYLHLWFTALIELIHLLHSNTSLSQNMYACLIITFSRPYILVVVISITLTNIFF